MSPEDLFQRRIAADPGAPLVTFYDDASGERAELSAKSMGNWIAKTHFLLLDELGLGVGDRAYLTLPVHWLAVPILFGCWFAGLTVVGEPATASVVFGDEPALAGLNTAGAEEVYAVSLLSMARSGNPAPPLQDYAAAVRPQPDAWATVTRQAADAEPALDHLSRSALADRARARAGDLGLAAGGRLMWSRDEFGPAAWVDAILAPLAVGGSAVLVRHVAPAALAARAEAERVSVHLD